jgi:hypothetical protein
MWVPSEFFHLDFGSPAATERVHAFSNLPTLSYILISLLKQTLRESSSSSTFKVGDDLIEPPRKHLMETTDSFEAI